MLMKIAPGSHAALICTDDGYTAFRAATILCERGGFPTPSEPLRFDFATAAARDFAIDLVRERHGWTVVAAAR